MNNNKSNLQLTNLVIKEGNVELTTEQYLVMLRQLLGIVEGEVGADADDVFCSKLRQIAGDRVFPRKGTAQPPTTLQERMEQTSLLLQYFELRNIPNSMC